jgi:hypothetical protein
MVVRVPHDLELAFRQAVASNGVTPSEALRALMDSYVVETAKALNDGRRASRPGDAMPTPTPAVSLHGHASVTITFDPTAT